MNTLLPFSVEAEKCFSAAGLFITTLRFFLNDSTIDILCFISAKETRKLDKTLVQKPETVPRVGTVNVEILISRSAEMVEILGRNVDICALQEVR